MTQEDKDNMGLLSEDLFNKVAVAPQGIDEDYFTEDEKIELHTVFGENWQRIL